MKTISFDLVMHTLKEEAKKLNATYVVFEMAQEWHSNPQESIIMYKGYIENAGWSFNTSVDGMISDLKQKVENVLNGLPSVEAKIMEEPEQTAL